MYFSMARSGGFWESAYFYLRMWLLLTSRDSGSLANFSWAFVSVLLLETGKASMFSRLWSLDMRLVDAAGDGTQNLLQARQAVYL